MNRKPPSRAFTVTAVRDGQTYEVRSNVDTLRIASGGASATLAFTASCYMKSGNSAPVAYACYFSVYFRTGTGQSQAARYTGKVSSRAFSGITVAKTVGAVVIYATDTVVGANAAAPTTFLAKKEIAVLADGDSPESYEILLTDAWARCDKNGHVTGSLKGYAYKVVGETWTAMKNAQVLMGYSGGISAEFTTSGTGAFSDGGYFDDDLNDVSTANNAASIFVSIMVGGRAVRAEYVTIVHDGQDGDSITGATGKMCYIAGEYDPTIIYRSDDRQTVAVEVDDGSGSAEIYYLDAATNLDANNNHISPQQDTGHTIWKQGLNRENLIRTKYLFADFANLGAFIVSGQWQMSASGVIRGMDASGNPAFTRYNTTDPDNPAMHGGVAAYTGFNSDDPLGQGVDKQTGPITKTLARNTAQSAYYALMRLTAGRDLYVEASGYANGYSDTRLALYRRSGDSWVLVQDLMTFTSTTNATKRATYVCNETAYYYLRLEHATTSSSSYGSSQVTVAVAREYGFTPTQAVDGLTGAMIGALGNFQVKGNGEVNIAGGKVHVDADGNVTMDNVTIRGSLMYHKVLVDKVNNYIRPFTFWKANGTGMDIDASGPVANITLHGDTIIISGSKRDSSYSLFSGITCVGYTIILPPARFFEGMRIRIINGTISGGNGTAASLNPSQINLAVIYREDTEEYKDLADLSYTANMIVAAVPVKFRKGTVDFTFVGSPDSVKCTDLTPSSANSFTVFGIMGSPNALYKSIELVAQKNPYISTYNTTQNGQDASDYAWMIISANE